MVLASLLRKLFAPCELRPDELQSLKMARNALNWILRYLLLWETRLIIPSLTTFVTTLTRLAINGPYLASNHSFELHTVHKNIIKSLDTHIFQLFFCQEYNQTPKTPSNPRSRIIYHQLKMDPEFYRNHYLGLHLRCPIL